jgi:hypothetical protein
VPALLARHVVDLGTLEQVSLQGGGDLVLGAGALANELRPSCDEAPERPGPFVGTPDLGDEARGEQLREPAGVEAVRLLLCLRDLAQLLGVGDDYPRQMGPEDRGDRLGAARHFEHHLVVRAEALRKELELFFAGPDPARGADLALL